MIPRDPLVLVPGRRVSIERRVVTPDRSPGKVLANTAWLEQVGTDRNVERIAAPLGMGTLDAEGVFRLETTVPTVLARRDARMGPVSLVPVAAGDYVITLDITDTTIPVRIQRDATATALVSSVPTTLPATRQLLGAGSLAGVAFGTDDRIAEAALRKIFGEPLETTDWAGGCVDDQYRTFLWPYLGVEFRRDDAQQSGRLYGYQYRNPNVVEGLGTSDGIRFGTTVAELRSFSTGVFHTGYDSFVANRWTRPEIDLAVILDGDALDPSAHVAGIASPAELLLSVC